MPTSFALIQAINHIVVQSQGVERRLRDLTSYNDTGMCITKRKLRSARLSQLNRVMCRRLDSFRLFSVSSMLALLYLLRSPCCMQFAVCMEWMAGMNSNLVPVH